MCSRRRENSQRSCEIGSAREGRQGTQESEIWCNMTWGGGGGAPLFNVAWV